MGTKNIGRPPHWVTYTEFNYECQDTDGSALSAFTHFVTSKQFIDSKDWSRDDINEWLYKQGIKMRIQKDEL